MKYIAVVLSLIAGVLISLLGNLIGNKLLKKKVNGNLSVASMIRQFLSIGYLFALFFVLGWLNINPMASLVAGAVGVTFPSLIIAFKTAKKIGTTKNDKYQNDSDSDGKEKEGEVFWKDQK